jgi:FkbM family methyltransferase
MNKGKAAIVEVLQRFLPEGIKKSLFHLSFHLAHAEFESFAHKYSFAPNMEYGLSAMAKLGFSPKTVIDVGAFEGNWSKLARRIWPESALIMIEPNLEKQVTLTRIANDLQATLYCELLGAENDREVTFHLMESGSSIFEERSPVPRSVEIRKLRRLDTVVDHIEPPGFLKIDAQGYELHILRGTTGLLPHLGAVLLEVAVIEINKGAPLLHDVVAFMKSCGLVAYDVLEIHRRPLDMALNQIDIVFVNEQSPLIADKQHWA